MVFKLALFGSLFLGSLALAVPSSQLEARLARRQNRLSQSLNRVESHAADNPSIQYYDTENWAGVSLTGQNGTFTSVSGTFTVPIPSGNSGDAACAWVGIDGDGCGQGLLQTGIDFTVTDDGYSYDAWYEWYPAYSYDFSGIDIHAGDIISVNVTAYSTTSGIAILENLTTGQIGQQVIQSSYALCQSTAEWIVEDFESGTSDTMVPFADFGTVNFTNAVAAGSGGTYTPCNPADLELDVLDIQQNEQVYTAVTLDGCNITINYA